MKKSTLIIFSALVSVVGIAVAADTTPTAPPPTATPAAQTTPVAPATIKVEKMAIGTAIDNREISGEATAFDSSVTRVFAWTKISSGQAPVTIKHVWSTDGKEEATVPLVVTYNASRTWSSKSVWPGSWKVDVTDDQGNVLASKEFTVSKEAAPPAKSAPPAQVGQ